KAFDVATIPLNGTSVLTFTLSNPNTATAFTGVAFTDTLPAGLTVPNDPGSSHCGGALTISSNVITFSGGTLAAGASCNFTVTVTGTTAGGKNNVTGNVSATNGRGRLDRKAHHHPPAAPNNR